MAMNKSSSSWAMALMLIVMTGALGSAQTPNKPDAKPPEVTGTWSGTMFSKHSNVAPSTITIVINRDARGHLVGTSSLNSNCYRGTQLQVTISGSTIVLAGSDEGGDSMTVRGTMDESGTILKSTYIMNGSATGKCETDDGTVNLAKR